MNLSHEFDKAANLGVIAKKWLAHLEKRFDEAGIVSSVKTGVDGAASLLSPAALIALLIKKQGFAADDSLRVLVLGNDPVSVLDGGVWLGFAADLAGVAAVDCYSTCREVIHSSLHEQALALGLKGSEHVTLDEARFQSWDLVVWIHPAIEAGECDDIVSLLPEFHSRGLPVYACMYNELDALIQSHGLASIGLEFGWLDSPVANTKLSKASISRYGYATAEVGIEGGWGAVITRLQPASANSTAEDWASIKVAMALYRLEGSSSAEWCLGQVLAGVSFNKCRPVGLIGNLAVDPETGLMFAECPTTKVLSVVGYLWTEALASLPKSNFDLVAWAARMKLAFNYQLTKEDKKREETIQLLETAYASGMTLAGIALARGLEQTGKKALKERAHGLYAAIGNSHPMSAYAVAHDALARGDEATFMASLTVAAEAGYAPAMTDLACVMKDAGDATTAARLFTQAMERGDAEAAFRTGEMMIKAGQYEDALQRLRTAWSNGHRDALNTAHWLCSEMLKHGLGKHGRLKRELKDISFAISKRVRMDSAAESAVA